LFCPLGEGRNVARHFPLRQRRHASLAGNGLALALNAQWAKYHFAAVRKHSGGAWKPLLNQPVADFGGRVACAYVQPACR